MKKINMQKVKKYLPGLAIVAIFLGVYLVYKNMLSKDSITVTGKATHEITNQIANFSVTIEVSDEDRTVAVTKAEERANEIISDIKEFSIPDKDVKTQNLNIYQRDEPVFDENIRKYEPGDWYATYTVEIILRDLDKSSELTALLAGFEDTKMWGPNLRVDMDEIDEEAILTDAIEDARQKASAMAIASGKKIGKVVNIVEGGPNGYGIGLSKSEGVGGIGFPVEPGSSSVTKTVTVTFRLR